MSSLDFGGEPRLLQGLLTGLAKKNFYGETAVTSEYLREQIYAGAPLTPEGALLQISEFERLLLQAADENWTPSQMEAFLAQVRLAYVSVHPSPSLFLAIPIPVHSVSVQSTSN